MPKLKSVMAGLAISTGLSGGLLAMGATTPASAGTTQATSGAPVLIGNGCGWRCGGWGWGRRHNNRTNVFVHNNNQNFNYDKDRHYNKEYDIEKWFKHHGDDDD
ncbi:hypothetical protein [Nonomuraea sp. NPDC049400]|uniref:hypothetical protein n=1 Tax=Nonomuraea sp. NPDC049400 TaxID=3364352 RepID=UPI0037A654BA